MNVCLILGDMVLNTEYQKQRKTQKFFTREGKLNIETHLDFRQIYSGKVLPKNHEIEIGNGVKTKIDTNIQTADKKYDL